MEEKNRLSIENELIHEIGADLDDLLESLEEKLKIIEVKISSQEAMVENHSKMNEILFNDLVSGNINTEQFKIGKNVSDILCKNLKNEFTETLNEKNKLLGKVFILREIVQKLKIKYDSKKNKIISLENYQKLQEQLANNETTMTNLLMKRPSGIHPGNPLLARKIIVPEVMIEENENSEENNQIKKHKRKRMKNG